MEDRYTSGRIYVGNLPRGTTRHGIKYLFESVGKVRDVSFVFGYHYAFVTFENPNKAFNAIDMNGCFFNGNYLKVEFTKGHRSDGRNRYAPNRRIPQFSRESHCVLVTGLPVTARWQDLKDHMRSAGEVLFANTYSDGSGVAEYKRREDMREAVKRLNLTRLTSNQGEKAYIRVFEAAGSNFRGGSRRERTRSRSRSGPRSPSPAPYRRGPPRSPSPTYYRRGPRSPSL